MPIPTSRTFTTVIPTTIEEDPPWTRQGGLETTVYYVGRAKSDAATVQQWDRGLLMSFRSGSIPSIRAAVWPGPSQPRPAPVP